MHQREREADRLLERAKRELWTDGSASRRELEAQIRIFLCRYVLGCAASQAKLRFSFIRPAEANVSAEKLRECRYVPLATVPGMWFRLDLDLLQLPLARNFQEGISPER